MQEPPDLSSQGAAAGTDHARCIQCGGIFFTSDTVSYQGQHVCAGCKPTFFQRLREGQTAQAAFSYGGFWLRFAAKLIDTIVMYVVQIPLTFLMFRSMMNPDPQLIAQNPGAFMAQVAGYSAVSMVLVMAYNVFFVGRFGATPGKMALKLKVVLPDGASVSYLRAAGRYLAELLTSFTCLIGYIVAAFDGQARTLHDHIASTRVIRTG